MPATFLLPLFVLTLLANAVLVVAAIRGMRRGDSDPDEPRGTGRQPAGSAATPAGPGDDRNPGDAAQPITAALTQSIAARRALLDPEPSTPNVAAPTPGVEQDGLAATDPSGSSAADLPSDGVAPAAPDDPFPSVAEADARPDAPVRPKRRRTTKAADAAGDAVAPRRTERRRGRRRFSLPPLDDDHERVSRSIESFLGGVDPGVENEAAPVAVAPAGATTVAIVVVDGLPGDPGTDPGDRPSRRSGDRTGTDEVAEALAMVERTLRGAARATDHVTVGAPGRFQIVLAATGELAARAYLRRIRAAIEPRLETTEQPLRLVVATATVLDESLETAIQRAEHRLEAVLGAVRSDEADDEAAEPRAAGD